MFEEKGKRYRLVYLDRYNEKVLSNLDKYEFLKVIGSYEKKYDTTFQNVIYVNLIVDSDVELDYEFVKKFNSEVKQCLGAFEVYEQYFD